MSFSWPSFLSAFYFYNVNYALSPHLCCPIQRSCPGRPRLPKLTMTSGPDPVVEGHKDYFQTIFRRCVAAILGSYGAHIEPEAFDYIVLLAELHMHELYTSLASIAHIQRRTQPAVEDLALLFSQHNINSDDLLREKSLHTVFTEQLAALQFDPELEPIPDSAAAFFDTKFHNITSIVPSKRKMPNYVPKWMPPLPPDHTYMESSVFTNHVRSLQVLREQLVEEGRLAEQALQRLLGQGGSEALLEVEKPAVRQRQPEPVSTNGSAQKGTPNGDAPSSYITVVDQEPEEPKEPKEPKAAAEPQPAEEPVKTEPSNVEPVKVKLPTLRISMGKETARPLSLSLSLGKPSDATQSSATPAAPESTPVKRPKTSDIFGKRPKIDIAKLAKEHETGQPVGPFKPWDRPLSIHESPNTLPSVIDALAAAMATIEKQ